VKPIPSQFLDHRTAQAVAQEVARISLNVHLSVGGMDSRTRPKTSMDTNRFNTSSSSGAGLDEDKVEVSANQAVVWLLGSLCAFERDAHSSCERRLSFRLSDFKSPLTFRNDRLAPKLMLHGKKVESYNDGAYYIETRSTRRPTEWVKRDKYPRASVEVRQSQWENLIPFASAKEKDIPAIF